MDRNYQITQDFNLNEFIRAIDPMPSNDIINNIIALAHRLQTIRDILKKPITINSGYRTIQHNAEVGGQPTSYHLKGMAADLEVLSITPHLFQSFMKGWSGGMGSYNTWTHLDIGPCRRWSGNE